MRLKILFVAVLNMLIMSKPAYWDEQICLLHNSGLSRKQIAERIGCSVDTVTAAWRRAELSHGNYRNKLSEDLKATVAKCLADGWSHAEIMRTYHVGPHTLNKYFPNSAWSRDMVNELSSVRQQLRKIVKDL